MLNIRPMDLQVLMPRTMDAAKIASNNEQQSVTQQQQLAVRLKQTVEEQQHQVQTSHSPHHEGKVTMDERGKEKQNEQRKHEGRNENETLPGNEADGIALKMGFNPVDPIRGHKIDIKT